MINPIKTLYEFSVGTARVRMVHRMSQTTPYAVIIDTGRGAVFAAHSNEVAASAEYLDACTDLVFTNTATSKEHAS